MRLLLSPGSSGLLGHIYSLASLWVLPFGSMERKSENQGKGSIGNQLLLNALFLANTRQGHDPATALMVLLRKRTLAERFSAFKVLTSQLHSFFLIPLYSLLSCVLTPRSCCIFDFIFAFLMPQKSCSEKGSIEGAGVSVALTDTPAGLVGSAGTSWVQSNPGVILGCTQVWAAQRTCL